MFILLSDWDPSFLYSFVCSFSFFVWLYLLFLFSILVISLICSCATKAKEMGYKYIGIQFYGECWAGDYFARPLKEKRSCIDLKFRTCQKMGPRRICSGEHWTNFIYELQEVSVTEREATNFQCGKWINKQCDCYF